ncbi:plakophilin-1 [Puntigrus tetrazona]|uniref:plakophilin-1 n=1 Tax=Puntigrus tetrazona TaxID=1606681 RepID=UPI001C8ADE91|nr:plakophilin-1 [Puntigrus tetrazona]
MTAEPIRSALGTDSMEDTSLVLPSDKHQRTGKQRVLEQVNTIKRSKSKMVKNDSVPTPTTPASATEYSEPKFQFSPTKLNDTLFKFSGSNVTSSRSATGRSLSVRNMVRRQTQNSQWESQMTWKTQSQSNGMRRGDSDPTLNKAGGTVTKQPKMRSYTVRSNRASGQSMRLLENNLHASTIQSRAASARPSLNQSQTITKVTSTKNRSEALGASGAEGSFSNITMEKAVEYLSQADVNLQLTGASFIQHHTFTEDSAKQEVWRLGGIPALIQLLKSDNLQLQQAAAATLRNLVFKDNNNKLEVERCEGIEAVLTLFRNTTVIETQKQLTGLLWNLSSADELKPELIKTALPLLTESVVVPYNFWTNKHIDSEVFYNTTGCLRNLSCASDQERILMRSCPGLIDSLVTYVQNQLDSGDQDDKSVENCVCILHNLSYQLEKEAPDHFSQFAVPDEKPNENNNKKSLFSPKSTKTQKDFIFPAMDKEDPEGVAWLYNQKSLQMYLSLLACGQKEATLEACCGALQNLTASKSPLSTLMSQSIIQKRGGLSAISHLLKAKNPSLQKTAMSLVGNMSRVTSLRGDIAQKILPDVSTVLSAVTPNMAGSDSSLATACRVMNTLMLADPVTGKKVINATLVDSLIMLSKNVSFDSARKAAGVLLYSMWGQKDIQSVLKKQGLNKDMFINDVTATAYKTATNLNGH